MINKKKIEEMIQKWKAKRATTEQKAIIRDLESLLESGVEPKKDNPEH